MKKSNKHKSTLKARIHTLVVPALIMIQFIAIGVLAFYAYRTHQELYGLSSMRISNQIINAVDGTSKEVNIDPQTGKVYLHEARLVLPPANDSTQALRYSYTPEGPGQDHEVRIVDASYLNVAKAPVYSAQSVDQIFSAVPKLQSCARGYLVTFKETKDMGVSEAFHKQLKDGRTAYVYLENECSENKANMLPYLQQLESY